MLMEAREKLLEQEQKRQKIESERVIDETIISLHKIMEEQVGEAQICKKMKIAKQYEED